MLSVRSASAGKCGEGSNLKTYERVVNLKLKNFLLDFFVARRSQAMPLAIIAAIASMSGDGGRSSVSDGTIDAHVRVHALQQRRGRQRREQIDRLARAQDLDRDHADRELERARSALSAAPMLMLTWSSRLAEVGMVSTLAGCASVLISEVKRGRGDLRHHVAGLQAAVRRQERRQVAQRRIDQPVRAPLADGGELRQRRSPAGRRPSPPARRESCRPTRSRRASANTIGLSVAALASMVRVVATKRERIARRAVHLRRAAQRVRVLHPAAVLVRLVDGAAVEQPPHVGRRARAGRRTAGRRGCAPRTDAPIRAARRSTARPRRRRRARAASAPASASAATAVDGCVPLISASPSLASSVTGASPAARERLGARLGTSASSPTVAVAFADQHERQMGERREVAARADRSAARARRGWTPAVEQREQVLERRAPDAREALGQHVGAQRHRRAHGADRAAGRRRRRRGCAAGSAAARRAHRAEWRSRPARRSRC